MFLRLAPAIHDAFPGAPVALCVPARNDRLVAAIEAAGLAGAEVVRSPFAKGPGEPYRAPLRLGYRAFVRRLVHRLAPRLVILVQGRIEAALVPLIEAKAAGLRVMSYLPMAHPVAEIRGDTPLNRVLDRARRPYYAAPDLFAVPTRTVEAQLRRAQVRAPVHVVPNIVEGAISASARPTARRRLGLPADARLALVMGRIDRAQKGLDDLVDRIAGFTRPGWIFVLVGDGPDSRWLDAELARRELTGRVTRVGWTDVPQEYYRASDVVLLPSRFEGMPLVILEALLHRRPVVASPIEAHAELLPPRALASFTEQHAFETAFLDAAHHGEEIHGALFRHAPRWRDIDHSRRLFRDALLQTLAEPAGDASQP